MVTSSEVFSPCRSLGEPRGSVGGKENGDAGDVIWLAVTKRVAAIIALW